MTNVATQTELAPVKNEIAIPGNGHSIAALLDKTVERLGGEGTKDVVEAIGMMLEYRRQEEQREAVKAFNRALTQFRRECPPIPRDKEIPRRGRYATLEQIQTIVDPLLGRFGLTYTWNSRPGSSEGRVVAITTLRHEAGHSESSEFEAKEDQNMAVNDTQKGESALSYGRRITLGNILGLNYTDPNAESIANDDSPKITDHQLADLEALIDEIQPNMTALLKYYGVQSLEDLTQRQFGQAVADLERKRRRS